MNQRTCLLAVVLLMSFGNEVAGAVTVLGVGAHGSAPDEAPKAVSIADWSGIHAAYEAGRHAAFVAEDGYRARNPGQQWTTHFDGRGFTATPDVGGWSWGLELVAYGWGRNERTVSVPQCVSAEGGRVVYDWDDQLTEWYVNDPRGVEHGYTVHERPAADGPLTLQLAVRGGLAPFVGTGGRAVNFTGAEGGPVVSYAGLTVFDADRNELAAKFSNEAGALRLTVDDTDARYPLTIDPIAQQAYLKASNTEGGDWFGYSVAVSGDTVVVGAPHEDCISTGVNGNQNNDIFGGSDSGAAYVFVRSGTTWSQQAYLKASNTGSGDWFGYSVSISGDTIVVGARFEASSATGVNGDQTDNSFGSSGAAYVFVRSGTAWSQQAYLKASNTGGGDQFGQTVSVAGDTIVVGAHLEDSGATGVNGDQGDTGANAGAAYVFVRTGTNWSQQAYLKASNTGGTDEFGWSVAVFGDTVVVGAPLEDSDGSSQNDNSAPNSGAGYAFVRSGTAWSQLAYIKASNVGTTDNFGSSVSVSGDTVIVGAKWEDSSATGVNGDQSSNSSPDSGAAYVFGIGTGGIQQAYLKASNTDAGDEFGYSVSISDNTIVVGAWMEDSNAVGVNGDLGDDSATDSGAAYVFGWNGAGWSQQAYLKASNTGSNDQFGNSISVSEDVVTVGARLEDSNATGVNGDQSNNSAMLAGAAYIFDLDTSINVYCSGDGSLPTACPCVPPNTVPVPQAAPGHGCANSLDLDGALLLSIGTTSPDTLTIRVDVAPTYLGFGFLVKGNASDNSGIASSDGVRCVNGQLIRFGGHNAGTSGNPVGQWIYPNTAQTTPISAATLQVAGQTAYYQLFYRNAAASFCTTATANWSNGLMVTWP